MLETLLIFLAEPAIAGVMKWAIGAAVTYFVAKPMIEKWGSTPNNRGAQFDINPQDIHDYARKDKQGKLDYVKEKTEERNKELQDENDKLRADINKLEQRKIREAQDWKNETDPAEKARKLATMEATQKEIDAATSQLKKNEREIKSNHQEVTKIFDELSKGAEKLTEAQIKAKNNAPDLGSWLNWGIIAIGVITAVLIVKFIFGMFKKFNKEIG